jgi:hypothetical protein
MDTCVVGGGGGGRYLKNGMPMLRGGGEGGRETERVESPTVFALLQGLMCFNKRQIHT